MIVLLLDYGKTDFLKESRGCFSKTPLLETTSLFYILLAEHIIPGALGDFSGSGN